jgi:DNA-directed RNA polymerase subunit alpha
MRIRWKGFELPTQVHLDEETKTETYGKFVIEPFERGFGITIGNSLRRVLLSSLEGTAPVSMRIQGALHEFGSIPGIVEDVINIALNVKGLLVQIDGEGPETLKVSKSGRGPVTAGDLEGGLGVTIINKDLLLATIEDDGVTFEAEIEMRKGRGYIRTEDFTWKVDETLGTIPLDAAFSPVRRSRWRVEETRVGKMTNYDRLILEVWTNATVDPEDALVEAALILRKHINPFVKYYEIGEELTREAPVEEETPVEETEVVDREVAEKLEQPVSALDLSVRASNCLAAEGIRTIGDLLGRGENEMLQVRNFGKTSLKEIKIKLAEMGLSFGMNLNQSQNQS